MCSHPRPWKLISPTIRTRNNQPLCQGSGLTLLHRVEGDSPHWGEHWCATEHIFAPICIHLHICSMKKAHTHTNKHGKHIYRAYIYVLQAPYIHICPEYMHIMQYITLCLVRATYIYIYIYIYMQHETKKYHMQATSAAGKCSQRGITIHWSPPEATICFYQEISR